MKLCKQVYKVESYLDNLARIKGEFLDEEFLQNLPSIILSKIRGQSGKDAKDEIQYKLEKGLKSGKEDVVGNLVQNLEGW